MDGNAGSNIKPALGLTWADVVTTRLMLTRPEGVESNPDCNKVSTLLLVRMV
jgi:hypothetical protein